MALLLKADNISTGWARAAQAVVKDREVRNLVLEISFNRPGKIDEVSRIRNGLDQFLRTIDQFDCHTVANTIFPQSLWNHSAPAAQLFGRYKQIWTRLQKARGNHNGVYFQRLIAYPGESGRVVNQLEHVIATFKSGNHRRSALAASVFDPRSDHTNQRQRGFPCLDHLLFTPDGNGGLSVSGYYATQDLIRKAYGNYLGLARLGLFVGHYMGLELRNLTCIASIARHDQRIRDIEPLMKVVGEQENTAQ